MHEVDIDLLDINLDQPRKRFDEDRLAELSSSIKLHGIVQPIIVRRKGDRYVIVAGERRYRAARMAGMKTVPAIIREFDERQFMEVALIENIQRENLNSMEIAAAIDFLIKQHDLTHEEIAHRIGKSRVSVTQIHRLLSLPPKVQEYIREGRLQFGHARPLVGVGDPALQSKLADRAIEQGWSSRELERNIAHELNRTPKPRSLPRRIQCGGKIRLSYTMKGSAEFRSRYPQVPITLRRPLKRTKSRTRKGPLIRTGIPSAILTLWTRRTN